MSDLESNSDGKDFLALDYTESGSESEDIDVKKFDSENENFEDSDSAPESISFKDQQEKFMQFNKQKSEVMNMKKGLVKKKRNEIHLRNVEQKQEKLKKLTSKMLPDDLLEKLDDSPEDAKDLESNHQVFDDQLAKDQNSKCVEEDSKLHSGSDKTLDTHGATVFKLKILPKDLRKRKVVRPLCSDYHDILFSSRIRREENSQVLFSEREKKLAQQKRY